LLKVEASSARGLQVSAEKSTAQWEKFRRRRWLVSRAEVLQDGPLLAARSWSEVIVMATMMGTAAAKELLQDRFVTRCVLSL
jgi:hypothetical protein